MLTNLRTPGVYIDEESLLPPSVVQVPTAIPVFIGHTERIEYNGEDLQFNPKRIVSYSDYIEKFGPENNPEVNAGAVSVLAS